METFDRVIAFLASLIPAPFNTVGFGTPQMILLVLAAAVFYWAWIRPLRKEK